MSLWRLEWLRLLRTKRWVALLGVYIFFGFLGPLTARYLSEIVSFAGAGGATINFPPPVPADGMAQYVSNALQLGTLVSVVVAAGAVGFDAVPEMGVFLRTRVPGTLRILLPRMVVVCGAIVFAFVAGSLAAWYETWALLGSPGARAVLAGIGFGSIFLVFVVALVGAVSARLNSVLGTVMVSIVILLLMPVVSVAGAAGRWLPSHLAGALGELPAGGARPSDYLGAAVVTLVATVCLTWLAVVMAARREL